MIPLSLIWPLIHQIPLKLHSHPAIFFPMHFFENTETTIVENIENIKIDLGRTTNANTEEKSIISESEKRKLKEYLVSYGFDESLVNRVKNDRYTERRLYA